MSRLELTGAATARYVRNLLAALEHEPGLKLRRHSFPGSSRPAKVARDTAWYLRRPELYRLPEDKIRVIPLGVDPAFSPGAGEGGDYLLFVGAVQRRKDPRAALNAAEQLRMPLVVVGPEREPEPVGELRRLGADLRRYVDKSEPATLYRGAACR